MGVLDVIGVLGVMGVLDGGEVLDAVDPLGWFSVARRHSARATITLRP